MVLTDLSSERDAAFVARGPVCVSCRFKEPRREELEPQLLLLPEPVREAILSWARAGSAAGPAS